MESKGGCDCSNSSDCIDPLGSYASTVTSPLFNTTWGMALFYDVKFRVPCSNSSDRIDHLGSYPSTVTSPLFITSGGYGIV